MGHGLEITMSTHWGQARGTEPKEGVSWKRIPSDNGRRGSIVAVDARGQIVTKVKP